MQQVIQNSKIEISIQKSRFISYCEKFTTPESIKKRIQELKEEYPGANHVCYAWRLISEEGLLTYRFADDGEPSGTAGKPILNFLEGEEVVNAAVFVVRFFGGIKLGSGGLVKAYGQSSRDAILAAELKPWKKLFQLSATTSYENLRQVEYLIGKQPELEILEKEFGVDVKIKIQGIKEEEESIKNTLNPFLNFEEN